MLSDAACHPTFLQTRKYAIDVVSLRIVEVFFRLLQQPVKPLTNAYHCSRRAVFIISHISDRRWRMASEENRKRGVAPITGLHLPALALVDLVVLFSVFASGLTLESNGPSFPVDKDQ